MAINAQELQGQWNNLRGQVKQKWGQLTDDDLQIHQGNVDQLVGRIQQKTGEGRESIEKFLGELTSKGASTISQAAEAVSNYTHQATDRLRDRYGDLADSARDRLDMAQDMGHGYAFGGPPELWGVTQFGRKGGVYNTYRIPFDMAFDSSRSFAARSSAP